MPIMHAKTKIKINTSPTERTDMTFKYHQKVLFKHCDPAKIVFYPRYFEMMNDAVEVFFDEALDWPFEKMHETNGVPTVAISTQFQAPSRHGDHLVLQIEATKLGKASMDIVTRATCDDQLRFETTTTLVCVNRDGRPEAWPDAVRSKIEQFMKG